MVKISDKTDYSRFARPADDDEGIWLDHVEVHLVTHPVGQVKEMHVHDPPQDHVITMRSGRMRWTVENETFDAGPGDVIVTPAGVAHGYRGARERAGEGCLRRLAAAAEAGLSHGWNRVKSRRLRSLARGG
jgi:Cupin domain